MGQTESDCSCHRGGPEVITHNKTDFQHIKFIFLSPIYSLTTPSELTKRYKLAVTEKYINITARP